MNTGLIASRYAKALLLYALEEHVEETVYHEMTNVLNSFRQLPQIRSVLGNPVTKNADKVKLMLQMCGGTTPSKAYERFVHTLIDNSREELLMECSRQYIEQYREKKHIYVVRLTTATESDQMTVDRIRPVVPDENIVVVTNRLYADIIREQLPFLKESQILLEPARRNTAPCIAWAAYHIAVTDPQASMIVMPSDHLIIRESVFQENVKTGFDFVENNDALLTLGIAPSRPETGYGYIQIGDNVAGEINHVKTFTEKPDLDLAKVFLASGEFVWNSGIFLWKADVIKEQLRRHAPDIAQVFDSGEHFFGTDDERDYIEENFAGCPSNSIDYAVMERAHNVFVERVDIGWNDLGTWSALFDNMPKNSARNVAQNCNLLAYNSSGNIFAINGDKLVVASGLNNYVVADDDDVLLICPMGEEQNIKNIVNDVRLKFGDKFLNKRKK